MNKIDGYLSTSSLKQKKSFNTKTIARISHKNIDEIEKNYTIEMVIKQLKKIFPQFEIKVEEIREKEEIKQFISKKEPGKYLSISKNYLEEMCQNKETIEEGMQLINKAINEFKQKEHQIKLKEDRDISGSGIYIDENSTISYWMKMKAFDETQQTLSEENEKKQHKLATINKEVKKIKCKKLSYNSNELTSILLRTKNSRSADMVLTRAYQKLVNVIKCKSTGEYNENEVAIAIIHAKKVIKCAKMRVENFKKEEKMKKKTEESVRRKQEELARKLKTELEKRKKKNRVNEYAEINKANNEYELNKYRIDKEYSTQEICQVNYLPIEIPENMPVQELSIPSAEIIVLTSVDLCV